MSNRRPSALPPGAFTLLELLVSMTILSLLLVLLLSMVDSATQLWRANENRVDAYREARAAINTIATDLTGLQAFSDPGFFATEADKDAPEVRSAGSAAHMDGRLFFVTTLSTDQQESGKNRSDLCTVGYFLAYERSSLIGGGPRSYNLYRYLRSSDDTFTALSQGQPLDSGTTVDPSPTGNAELLAKNVVRFEIKPWTLTPGAGTNPTPTLEEFKKSDATPLPDLIEITLAAISNDAARRLSPDASGDWENETDPRLRQDIRTFTTRISLPQAQSAKPTPSPSPSSSP